MRLSWHRQDLHLHRPFTIARGTEVRKQTLVVELEHDGVRGLGEAVPTDYYGQTLDSAERTLAAIGPLLGDDPFNLQAILGRLYARFDDQLASVAAVDFALHDWLGKRMGLPTWRWLGLDADAAPPTSFTIGIDDPERVIEKVQEAAACPILKVKLGTGFDEQILRAVREAAPQKTVRVDANAAWTADCALDRVRMCARYGVEYVEQPVPPGDFATLKRLRDARILPIVADESAVRAGDVANLVGCVDGINVKLDKCGGIRAGLHMIDAARVLGMKVMLGCMIGSSLYIAALAQLSPLADWLDLDGHLLLTDDPFEGLGFASGRIVLSRRSGLGVTAARGV
jgi:L-alanine-DL-glutamate epimerase-like enolase superfamily enzyme